MKKLTILLLFVIASVAKQSVAQNLDSLKLALKNAKHDTTRCNILNAMVEAESDDAIWQFYNQQLFKLAEKNLQNNKLTDSQTFFFKQHISYAFNNIGYLAKKLGDISKALEYYHKSLKNYEEIKDRSGIATALYNIGVIYNNQGDIPKGLEYFHKSLRIDEELNNKSGIAYSLNHIANIYKSQGDIPKALEYFYKSLNIREEIKDKRGIANSLNNIGTIFEKQGEIQKALEYYHKSLQLREEINDKNGISYSLRNIGAIYFKQAMQIRSPDSVSYRNQLINKTLEYYHKSLKNHEEIKDKRGIAYSLINIAGVMLQQGRLGVALNYAERSMTNAKELGYPDQTKQAAKILKEIYQKQNKYKEAFAMYELEIQMRDSINNDETKKATIQKQYQYEYEKKALSDSLNAVAEKQRIENEEADKQAELDRIIFIQYMGIALGLVLVFILVIFIGRNYFSIKVMENAIVLLILLLFEFVLVVVDPMFQSYVGSTPLPILLLNVGLAIIFTPIHSLIEYKMKRLIFNKTV